MGSLSDIDPFQSFILPDMVFVFFFSKEKGEMHFYSGNDETIKIGKKQGKEYSNEVS